MTPRGRGLLILLLLASLLLRLGWGWSRPATEKSLADLPDQVEYLACARSLAGLAQGASFGFIDPRFGQFVYAQRTPGYPAFIALCGGNIPAVRIVQALIDVSTILAVFLIARKWLCERRALFAAGLVAVNPMLVYFSGLLLTETLYTAMLVWSIYLLVNRRCIFTAIFLLAISVLVRPSGLPFVILLPLVSGWLVGPGASARRGMGYGLLGAAVLAIVLLPWAVRNRQVLGNWVWLSSNSGITLYDGVWENAQGNSDQRFLDQMTGLRALGEVGRDRLFNRLANDEISKDPLRFGVLGVNKILRTWSPIPLSSQFGSNRLYRVAGLAYCLPLWLLALAAFAWSHLPSQMRTLLIMPALVITLLHAISVGSMRYRLPAEPLLAVLAASAGKPRRGESSLGARQKNQ